MLIEFNVKYFDNDTKDLLSNDLVNEYIQNIQNVFDQISVGMEVSSLTTIVIPDTFEDELFAFQKANGLKVEYTNNSIGVACAKTLHYIKDRRTCHTIFMSKFIAYFIMSDSMIEFREDRDILVSKRSWIINLLHHELAHVHYYSYMQACFNCESSYDSKDQIDRFYTKLSVVVWEEYFACRFSLSSFPTELIIEEYNNMLNYIKLVKSQTDKEIASFNTYKDSTRLFVAVQEGLQILLKSAAYLLAHLHFVEDDEVRLGLIKEINDSLNDTFFHNIMLNLSDQFDKIYDSPNMWKSYDVFIDLTRTVKLCFSNLDIAQYT